MSPTINRHLRTFSFLPVLSSMYAFAPSTSPLEHGIATGQRSFLIRFWRPCHCAFDHLLRLAPHDSKFFPPMMYLGPPTTAPPAGIARLAAAVASPTNCSHRIIGYSSPLRLRPPSFIEVCEGRHELGRLGYWIFQDLMLLFTRL